MDDAQAVILSEAKGQAGRVVFVFT